jgi:hypothetical protein
LQRKGRLGARSANQIATSNALRQGRGGRRYLPYAFTEHGAIIAATVPNGPQTVEMIRPRLFLRQTA